MMQSMISHVPDWNIISTHTYEHSVRRIFEDGACYTSMGVMDSNRGYSKVPESYKDTMATFAELVHRGYDFRRICFIDLPGNHLNTWNHSWPLAGSRLKTEQTFGQGPHDYPPQPFPGIQHKTLAGIRLETTTWPLRITVTELRTATQTSIHIKLLTSLIMSLIDIWQAGR